MSLIAALIVISAFVLWLVRKAPRSVSPARPTGGDGIDHEELEAAEREVRDLGTMQQPEDEVEGDDWGPGVARPRGRS
jgi:hypothetical protein